MTAQIPESITDAEIAHYPDREIGTPQRNSVVVRVDCLKNQSNLIDIRVYGF